LAPDLRSETSLNNPNGAGIIYKTNSGGFIYVQIAAGKTFCNPMEIGKGIVRLNNLSGDNQIVDINFATLNNDYSAFGLPCFVNYTNTSSLAYIKAFNAYSSSLDYGLIKADASTTNITPTFYLNSYSNTNYDVVLWDGQTGAYVSNIPSKNGSPYKASQYGTYVYNSNVPPGNDASYSGYGITMPFSSAVQTSDYAGYQLANLLPTSKYKTFFTLKGSFYAYDGAQIYLLPLSNGIGSNLNGVPQPMVNPYGLTFLTASCDYAFFLGNYDNSIWLYSGAREIVKGTVLSAKPTITAGWYNDYDNALYLQTDSTIITIRDDTTITENPIPFVSGTWNTFNTNLGLYFVQNNVCLLRTYEPVASSTLIPLSYQSGYLGYGSSVMFTVNSIKVRMYCAGGLSSTIAVKWYWVTQDSSGSDTSTMATTPLSASNYFTFEWTPPHNNVLMFSLAISDSSGTQKIVLLDIDAYTTYANEENIANKVL
jgi:hypothetical protein